MDSSVHFKIPLSQKALKKTVTLSPQSQVYCTAYSVSLSDSTCGFYQDFQKDKNEFLDFFAINSPHRILRFAFLETKFSTIDPPLSAS